MNGNPSYVGPQQREITRQPQQRGVWNDKASNGYPWLGCWSLQQHQELQYGPLTPLVTLAKDLVGGEQHGGSS